MRVRGTRAAAGFTLIEMGIFLVMITSLSLLAAHLFVSMTRLSREAQRSAAAAGAFDAAARRMREDAWGAASIASPSERVLVFERPEGGAVEWRLTEDGGLVRAAAGEAAELTWPSVVPGASFEAGAVVTVLRLPRPDGKGLTRVVMPSQLLLLREGTR